MKLSATDKQEVLHELKKRHPLYYYRLPLHEIFPLLKLCKKKQGGQDQQSDNQQILEEPQPRSDSIKNLDEQLSKQTGFNSLGFGTIAYFDFQESLICLFFIVCLITLPSLLLFSHKFEHPFSATEFNKMRFDIGNLGFSSAVCEQ